MSLEIMKKELELSRVRLARQEMEFRIQEREEEIIKLKENIKIQIEHENKLLMEIKK